MSPSASPDVRFYGRRKGKALKPNQAALLERLYPALRLDLPEEGVRVDPLSLFSEPASDVWLEIGFGGGEHLAFQAERHRAVGFIGAEPFVNGVGKFLALADAAGLKNVRIFGNDVRPLLRCFPDACLGRVFLLFPDPWPKARHWRRRFMNAWNLDLLGRLLKDGGELRVASDDPTYIHWTLREGPIHSAFVWRVAGADDWKNRWSDGCPTRYEQKALREGRQPHYFTFVRRSRTAL